LAYVPQQGSRLTNKMDFGERVKNTIVYGVNMLVFEYIFNKASRERRAKYNVPVSEEDSRRKVAIGLMQATFAVDYPRPITPAMKFVGPILPEPGKPLPQVHFCSG
jgi:ceramide galactosyltransferase